MDARWREDGKILLPRDPEDQDRLRSGKAVAAALILAGVVLAAAAVFLWVVLARACARPSI